jgi:hypothetical protein
LLVVTGALSPAAVGLALAIGAVLPIPRLIVPIAEPTRDRGVFAPLHNATSTHEGCS